MKYLKTYKLFEKEYSESYSVLYSFLSHLEDIEDINLSDVIKDRESLELYLHNGYFVDDNGNVVDGSEFMSDLVGGVVSFNTLEEAKNFIDGLVRFSDIGDVDWSFSVYNKDTKTKFDDYDKLPDDEKYAPMNIALLNDLDFSYEDRLENDVFNATDEELEKWYNEGYFDIVEFSNVANLEAYIQGFNQADSYADDVSYICYNTHTKEIINILP